MNLRNLLAAAFALIAASPCVAGALEVKFTIKPENTLPGIPVHFELTIRNASDGEVAFPNEVDLYLLTAEGKQLVPADVEGAAPARVPTDQVGDTLTLTLPARGEATYFFSPGVTLSENPFWITRTLSSPGSYRLQATVGGVWSNVSTLNVATPSGSDAAALQAMKRATGKSDWSAQDWATNLPIVFQILREFPESEYYRAASGFAVDVSPLSRMRSVTTAALAERDPFARERLLLMRAQMAEFITKEAVGGFDLDAARDASRVAAQACEDARRSTVSAWGKASVDALEADLTSAAMAEELISAKQALEPAALKPVTPFVECRDANGRTWFGYDNQNSYSVTITRGGRNMLTPASEASDRVPVRFRPGRHSRVVSTSGREAHWSLDGERAVVPTDVRACE